MKRSLLAVVLVAPLLAAVVYALWPDNAAVTPLPPMEEGHSASAQLPLAPRAAPVALAAAHAVDGGAASMTAAPFAQGGSPGLTAQPPPAQGATPAPATATGPTETAPNRPPPHPLDGDGLRGAIREKLPELRDCYEAWLQQNPELGGTLKLSFQINAADGGGVVQNIAIIDGGVGHVAFEGCVANVFDGLDFEPPESGPMNVTYPLVFSSTGAP